MSAPTTSVEKLKSAAFSAGGIIGAYVLGTIICKIASGRWFPTPALGTAAVYGSLNAMFAIGLVLIYRAGRIVNFAQGSLGTMGATLFVMLGVVEEWPFFLAFPAALAAAAATGALVEILIVRRMSKASRLALTVVTIGIGQVLVAVSGLVPTFFVDPEEPIEFGGDGLTPFSSFEMQWDFQVFSGDHIMTVVVAALAMVGLAAFFRFSNAGIAIRAAAENDDRAQLLGINVSTLSTIVWVIAAVLSGLAAVMNTTISSGGFAAAGAGATSAGFLLRGLAAAVVGRMESMPKTVAAALGIAVFEQSIFWAFDVTSLTDVGLLLLIVGVLLVQRGKLSRTDEGLSGTWAATQEIRDTPYELKDVPSVKAGRRRFLIALFGILAAFPWVMSPSQTSLGSVYLIYGIIVISLVVLTGWGGQISLGQFGFVAVGAVIGGSMTSKWGVPFIPALVLASLAGAAIAIILGLPAMRIKGLFLAVTTLAFSVCVATVFLSPRWFDWLLPGEITRPKFLFVNTEDERAYFYFCAAALFFTLWVAKGLRQSRAGRVLIAIRENERTAQSYAINLVRTRLATFAISGALAAFAGVLLAHQQHSVRPTAFAPEQSIQIFLIAIIGGLGSVPGALAGVAYYAAVNLFVTNMFGQLLASGIGVMVIMLLYPGGLGAMFFALRDAFHRRVAMRNRIYVPSLVGDHRVLDGEHTRVALAPKFEGDSDSNEDVPVKYRIPSTIGVRGESQQGRNWRWA